LQSTLLSSPVQLIDFDEGIVGGGRRALFDTSAERPALREESFQQPCARSPAGVRGCDARDESFFA